MSLRRTLVGAIVLLTFAPSSNAMEFESYGRFGSFHVKQVIDDAGDPRNCVIEYDNYADGSWVWLFVNNDSGLTLGMRDPAWDLPRNLQGSVIVESGKFQQRYRIHSNDTEFIILKIQDWERFQRAFTKNYEMTLHTPEQYWEVDLNGSLNAWNQLGDCIRDSLNSTQNDREENPWGGPSGSTSNPWR